MRRTIRATILAGGLALAAACGPIVTNHGYVPGEAALSLLVVGVDTMDSVEATVGRPSTSGVLQDDAWYYVRETRRTFGPARPRPIDRELVALSFDGDRRLGNVERFGLEDGRVVTLSRRVTETTIRDFGLIQQILRNFGRIDLGEAVAGGDG